MASCYAELMTCCERGDFVGAMQLLSDCGSVFFAEGCSTLLQVAAVEQNLEVCKRLLSPECSFMWPKRSSWSKHSVLSYALVKSFRRDALDFALIGKSATAKLPVVRLLVNAMRHKKGWLRENYIGRIRGPGFEFMLLDSLPVLEYLIRLSVEFITRRPQPSHVGHPVNDARIRDTIMSQMHFEPRPFDKGLVDRYVCQLESLAETFPGIFSIRKMRTQFFGGDMNHMNWRLSGLQVGVGLRMGWLDPSWPVVYETVSSLHYFGTPALTLTVRALQNGASPAPSVDLASKIFRATFNTNCPPSLMAQILEMFESCFDAATFWDAICLPVYRDLLEYKLHNVSATLFVLRVLRTSHGSREESTASLVKVMTAAVPSISASLFYHIKSSWQGLDLTAPRCMGRIMATATREMVYTAVWESDALATQLVSCCCCCCTAFSTIGSRVAWIKEMFGLRMLLRGRRRRSGGQDAIPSAPSNLLTPYGYPLPRRAALNILATGWLGELRDDFPKRLLLGV